MGGEIGGRDGEEEGIRAGGKEEMVLDFLSSVRDPCGGREMEIERAVVDTVARPKFGAGPTSHGDGVLLRV